MDPRLKKSTQWTPFPEELSQQAQDVLRERFSEEYGLEDWQFVVEGRIYEGEILGRFGLQSSSQLKQPNFELSVEFDSDKEKALELIQKSMDVVEHLFSEFLEEDMEDSELAKTWQSMPFEKKMFFYKYSTVNTSLEEQADKLLEEYEKKLVYQEENHQDDLSETAEDTTNHNLH